MGKCIYCGSSIDISESDIIPDALTNAKLRSRNVCRIEHNNKFSDLFEDEVIRQLAPITNHLDVKSSKSKRYPVYESKIIIGGVEYVTKISSNTEIFNGNKVLSTEDGKTKFGPLSKVSNIRNAEVTQVDINNADIEQVIKISSNIFFSSEMYRLIAKIAFEWYCLCNNVNTYIQSFDNVINFIVDGSGENPVTIVANDEITEIVERISGFANHTLLSYVGSDNSVNIIVSLFGIGFYNVRLLEEKIEACPFNVLYQMLGTDAQRNEFKFKSIEDLDEYLSKSFKAEGNCFGNTVLVPIDLEDTTLGLKFENKILYNFIERELYLEKEPNELLVKNLINRILAIFNTSVLTLRGLKRFVKEHEYFLYSATSLNPNGTKNESIFMYYVLFLVGIFDGRISCLQDLNTYLKENFSPEIITMTGDDSQALLYEIMSKEDYIEIIRKGAELIKQWDFQ